ncbi:hypothetical protein [Clostridium omnivorum]|uniref:Uncharacterized protein n=1 Tax=Clostridium omnivorum TaxID=1604902 RepID=A0ABQ5N666_9CLOT|nr:hypothetical protein [Clostridium sp. E14]GLC30703.1 hypothetical protein bsdE14_21130 [Clostridium sp. E14]
MYNNVKDKIILCINIISVIALVVLGVILLVLPSVNKFIGILTVLLLIINFILIIYNEVKES